MVLVDYQTGCSESMKRCSDEGLEAVRLSAQRGRPLGDDGWVESIARSLNLESTMRPRGRQRGRCSVTNDNKKA